MKALSTVVFFLSFLFSFSQAPEGMNYQAIARDQSGNAIVNQSIAVKFFIHDLTPTGAIVSTDSQSVTTNQFGLFTLVIGSGGGNLANVNWGNGSKFLQVEILPPGGATFLDMGTTQLMSVPYALYAHSVQTQQTLSISGNNLSISGGNTVTLPAGGSGTGVYTQTLQEGINYAFYNATSETGVDSFYAVSNYSYPGNNDAYGLKTKKDEVTGAYQITGYGPVVPQCGGGNGVVINGATTHRGATYYVWTAGCGTKVVSTLTGTVTIDIPPTNSSGLIFSDGQFVYLNNDTTWIAYNASGNAFHFDHILHLWTSSSTTSVMDDGSYLWSLEGGTLYKYSLSGANILQVPVFGNPTGLANIDATKLFLISASFLPSSTANTNSGTFIMTPIGKP